ncbi:MAG: hypothetical protein HZA93_18250 [Verrucomicrobia bacterium]|nr:hypothetical protein [Verrucomicrobiota bacterium]
MKDRTVWIMLVLLALIAGGIYFLRGRPNRAPADRASGAPRANPSTAPLQPVPAAPAVAPAADGPTVRAGRNGVPVPVQDGKTIDMSTGRPVVRDDERSRAAIEKAKKEMADAAADVTFQPQPAPKKADPAPKR